MFSDEELAAFAKGELAPEAAKQLEEALWRDPELAARLERVRAKTRGKTFDAAKLGVGLAAAGASLAGWIAPLKGPAPAFVRWGLLAAALAAGIVIGQMTAPRPVVRAEAGELRAGPELARALDGRLTQSPENARARLKIGESFKSLDGAYCRTFTRGGRGAVSGLACREIDGWEVRMAASGLPPQGDFAKDRTEAPAVLAMRDAMIVGAPLDLDQERAARAQHWR